MATGNMAMALRTAYLSVHRRTNACLMKRGVTADQFVCLHILTVHGPLTQQEISDYAASDPNTVRAMLVLLEQRGLIRRTQHPTDGRARRVALTPKGTSLTSRLADDLVPIKEKMLRLFTSQEAAALIRALDRLSAELRA